jgi:hypothetical protein
MVDGKTIISYNEDVAKLRFGLVKVCLPSVVGINGLLGLVLI